MSVKLILGIGNPGTRYAGTRHNLGFEVIRELASRHGLAPEQRQFRALSRAYAGNGHWNVLLKPQWYVNLSGVTARAALDHYQVSPASLLVIVDDIQLPLGRIRVRRSGSSGGHNGLKSISAHCGSSLYPRIRLGIGREGIVDLVGYVLDRFDEEERAQADILVQRGADAVEEWLRSGIEPCMNLFN